MDKGFVIKLDLRNPDMTRLREAIQAGRDGKLIVFPTETVYGLGGKMSAPGLEQRIRDIKGREENKPFSFHIGDWSMLGMLGVDVTPVFRVFARRFWPGPVTIIAKNKSGAKIGIRYPKNNIACALIAETGEPFIATSANLSGQLSPHTAKQAVDQLDGTFDVLIDGGKTELSQDSTVLDLSGEVPAILRKGAHAAEVEKVIEKIRVGKCPAKKILVVCTGNSCRSPMAEGWLKLEIEKRGLSEKIEVSSCGIGAREGLPASVESDFVMRNHGIDLSRHKSRQCRKGDVWGSDLVIVMADHHARAIDEIMPGAAGKTVTLDVEDPIGLGMNVYETTFAQIERKLRERLSDILSIS
jgi:tRNA threonylcarbamoyl adenosine modification protein (Sua5/YciO/YrdC/YwlC family)